VFVRIWQSEVGKDVVTANRMGVSAEMAIRLEKAGWSTAETWLRMRSR
jgi:plasmid maintenance system antidote protein VapI